ncbi:cell division protein ZapA [Sphingomonas oryzagri]|jgi:cell division protein ZapA|uniref:Cell division protein ZapA n=1 Tax=Sphingomonas oryzagri TaxID=3042314 RepID=A0ABT6N008_9SPHN|nr:cell division protein ZapA [Sphingomonas oryzagri]MDH7638639.1 cell division protein ZapA [Sphingomonas oryzagri]
MAQVNVEIGGRSYELSCRDGEEERLRLLGRLVDAKAADVTRAIGKASEARELLLTALLLADELDEARGAAARQRIEDAQRIAAMDRYAEKLESLAARLEKPAASA